MSNAPQPKSASTPAVSRSAHPNIVLILADDLGYGDLQCYCPESKIPTPRLDALAGEGMRFTDAHSPSAVCSPTRYGILTGRYAWRTRLKRWVLSPWDPPLIEAGRLTLPEMLRGAGYRTACIGKWHLGWQWPTKDGKPVDKKNLGANVDFSKPIGEGPIARGFDEYFGDDVPNFPPFIFFENDRTLGLPTARKLKSMHGHDGPMLPGFKQEDVMPAITKRAVAFVDRQAKESPKRPFFLYVPLTAPHTPIVPAAEFRGRSKAGLEGDYTVQVDDTVGQIVDALKRNGQADNTLLIFTSDNGSPGYLTNEHQPGAILEKHGHRPSGPLRGLKADAWEGGHRVPLIVRWPGMVKPGAKCDETTCLIDLMATLGEVVEKKLPEGAAEDSLSMLPLLTGAKHDKPLHETTILHSGDGTFIVRQGAWKLILGRGSGGFSKFQPAKDAPAGQLYKLDADLAEKNNLYNQHPEIVQRLTQELEKVKGGPK
ncbi:MAG: arylsulfatase [Planctomycetes bacterium]|nr:arylsulfatase [Planctomycetota bacterium]